MCQRTDRARLNRSLRELGRRISRPVRLYLAGGSVWIDLGLRDSTLDIDYVAEADDAASHGELEQAIRLLKDELQVNVEPASPADPVLGARPFSIHRAARPAQRLRLSFAESRDREGGPRLGAGFNGRRAAASSRRG